MISDEKRNEERGDGDPPTDAERLASRRAERFDSTYRRVASEHASTFRKLGASGGNASDRDRMRAALEEFVAENRALLASLAK